MKSYRERLRRQGFITLAVLGTTTLSANAVIRTTLVSSWASGLVAQINAETAKDRPVSVRVVRMVNYEKDIETEAKDFLSDHEDMFKEAIREAQDFDRNDIDDLDSAFHEGIVDRAYTPEDAVFVLEHCDNEETDSGLWEGQDWRRQLSARAAFSYANDVWFKAEEIYKQIKEDYETLLEDAKTEGEQKKGLNMLFEDYTSTKLKLVEKGSRAEKELIERWFRLASRSVRSGYPVGRSYIDSRCGTGHGMPDEKDFVDFDREFAQQVPHLAGKYKSVVKEYYEKTFGKQD